MSNDIVERFLNAVECSSASDDKTVEVTYRLCRALAEEIRSLRNPWIRGRFPEYGGQYLVRYEEPGEKAIYVEMEWLYGWVAHFNVIDAYITHWQPINPPEGET